MPPSDCMGGFDCFGRILISQKKSRNEINRYGLISLGINVLAEFINSDQELIDTLFQPRLLILVLNLTHYQEAI